VIPPFRIAGKHSRMQTAMINFNKSHPLYVEGAVDC